MAASTRFLEGFRPAALEPHDCPNLHLAFAVEGSWEAAGLCVRQEGDDLVADVYGSRDVDAVGSQLARIFSLDVDGSRFAEVGARDPVIGELQRTYDGLRPVCFWSAMKPRSGQSSARGSA